MRTCCVKLAVLLLGLSFFPIWNGAFAQNIIYVDQSASGADNGTSWTDGYTFLQDALQAAQSGDEIWVASGTYRPDQGASATLGDREAAFYIHGGISLYGGFSGIELMLAERDWEVNETILSGDLLGNDDELLSRDNPLRQDNAFHVVRIRDIVDPVVLDGLSIVDGMAMGGVADKDHSAGIEIYIEAHPDPESLVRISNCSLRRNVAHRGTLTVSVSPRTTNPTVIIEDSEVRNNWGTSSAGIDILAGTTLIRNVLFTENTAGIAAISGGHDDVYVIGSTISNNTGNVQVQVIERDNVDGTFYMWNTRLVGNTSGWGTIFQDGGSFLSVNNVFNGNTTIGGESGIRTWFGESTIVNNVFAFNTSLILGSVVGTWNSNTTISNSIFWQNVSPENVEFKSVGPSQDIVRVNHSLLQRPLPDYVISNGGLISGDPFFLDADGPDDLPGTIDDDFRLSSFSPAVDAGDRADVPLDFLDLDDDGNLREPWPIDFAGNRRFFNGGSGQAIVDMGAFEYDAPPISLSRISPPETILFSTGFLDVYPNPTTGRITITWNLPPIALTRLELIDVSGRRVRSVYEGTFQTGESVVLDLDGASSGVYYIRDTSTGSAVPVIIVE